MDNFKDITNSVNADLNYFEEYLRSISSENEGLIKEVLDFVFDTKGKRVRPVLVYLASRLFGEPTKSTHLAAILIEIMHTATLLHDDVVDEAKIRRSKPTINEKWDNKIAVLTGDYLFARAMKIATDEKEHRLFDIITPAIMSLSVGELQQMSNNSEFNTNLDKYFEVIENKTASLISVCCECGAYTSGASESEVVSVKKLGTLMGLIFQIKDDILDYNGNGATGKQIGIDLLEGKVTLPVICAWNNMNASEQIEFRKLWDIENKLEEHKDLLIEKVKSFGGIKGSYKTIESLKKDALEILKTIDNSGAKKAMIKLIDYIIDRDK